MIAIHCGERDNKSNNNNRSSNNISSRSLQATMLQSARQSDTLVAMARTERTKQHCTPLFSAVFIIIIFIRRTFTFTFFSPKVH